MGLRCFIAIPFPGELKESVASSVELLKAARADVRWVQPENLHLTLKFLGDTTEPSVPGIAGALDNAAESLRSFSLRISGAGVFPDWKRPRVIWFGVEAGSGLKSLQESIEDIMETFGYNRENRLFSPHLTIGRVRSQRNISPLVSALESVKGTDFGSMEVRSFSLMKSDLSPKGSEYTTLAEFQLRSP